MVTPLSSINQTQFLNSFKFEATMQGTNKNFIIYKGFLDNGVLQMQGVNNNHFIIATLSEKDRDISPLMVFKYHGGNNQVSLDREKQTLSITDHGLNQELYGTYRIESSGGIDQKGNRFEDNFD
ncbi:predicted protein [Naegleria gruberi]|uniref:Predicted protein n=1 Tax=Naegleria gruberi TaxID=5762 RepID=D2VMB6_NAEGR|nr:uncharacterized protein NAEGRDRAFT_70077 [Naegleria gruberi]EFC41959.1 predicted protein [Naegleria gruberi]|eukprot:XP_002674703.1 predicted protein [Naegleria gruberi strain NEG-M]